MNDLEYSFIRTEADNKITLFIKSEKSWLDTELDITVTPEKALSIHVPNLGTFTTTPLPAMLYDTLAYQYTPVLFCDDEGEVLAETVLNPLCKKSKNKP